MRTPFMDVLVFGGRVRG